MDTLFASVTSTLVNLRRNADRFPNPFPISDFVLQWGEDKPKDFKLPPAPQKTWQQLKMIGMICAAAYNAQEDHDKKRRQRQRGEKG